MSNTEPESTVFRLPITLIAENSNLTIQEIGQIEKLIIRDLTKLAHTYMLREREGHTLGEIGLLNETLLRVCSRVHLYKDKEHFYATAARIMRHVLVDYEKQRRAAKRGGDLCRADVAIEQVVATSDGFEVVELNEMIEKLDGLDRQMATIVDLKYFGGFTLEEIAETLKLNVTAVRRQLNFGKRWILVQLRGVNTNKDTKNGYRVGGDMP